MVIGALGTVTEVLKRLEDLEIREQVETIQLRSVIIEIDLNTEKSPGDEVYAQSRICNGE